MYVCARSFVPDEQHCSRIEDATTASFTAIIGRQLSERKTHTHFFLSRPLFRLVFFSFFYRCRACLAFHNVCRNAIKLENMLLQFSILFVLLFLFSVVDDRHVMVNSLSFLFLLFLPRRNLNQMLCISVRSFPLFAMFRSERNERACMRKFKKAEYMNIAAAAAVCIYVCIFLYILYINTHFQTTLFLFSFFENIFSDGWLLALLLSLSLPLSLHYYQY